MSNLKKNAVFLFEIISIAAIYYFSAKIGQVFAIPPGNITPIWLPSGIMLALMIIRGYRIWPGIFLGAFSGNAPTYLDLSDLGGFFASLFSGTMNGIGDVLCVVSSVYLMRRFSGSTNPFKDIVTFWQFLIFGVALGPLISAAFGVGSLTLTGIMTTNDALVAFVTWWVGDSVGVLLITPVMLAFYFPIKLFSIKEKSTELLLYIIVVFFISAVELNPALDYTLITDAVFLMIPLLFWSIFRFGHRITYITILYFFAISIYMTNEGYGLFNSHVQLFSLLQMQMYFMVVASCVFIVGALLKEKEELAQDMSQIINYDALTNAGSRRSFDEKLEHEIERAKRYSRHFSLVLCDLDQYKEVNDHYGQLVADQVLKQFVRIIQTNLRQTDSMYRWDDGEFIILLPETNAEKASQYAEIVRENVERAIFSNDIKLTTSIGVCQYEPEFSTRKLLKFLDKALFSSKQKGRNCTTVRNALT